MKKVLLIVVAVLISMSSLAGCAGNSNGGSSATASSGSSAAKEKVQLTLWHYFSSAATQAALTKQIDIYNQKADAKATIVQQFIPRDDLTKKYTLGVSTGTLPDFAVVDGPDSAAYSAMGLFADITARVKAWSDNHYMDGPLKAGIYNNKQYTLPLRSNCLALWVNDDMLKAAGITQMPTTWDEFTADCKKLKETNSKVYPFAFAAAKSEEATFQFIPFLYSAGATTDTLSSANGIKALTFVTNLVKNGYASKECINWGQTDVQKQFASGNAAMMLNGSWQIPNMKKDAPNLKYSIINLPKDKQYATCIGGENIGITSKCKDINAAWNFLTFMCGKEGNVPFNVDAGTVSPHSDLEASKQYPDNAAMQKFIAALKFAVPRGPSPKWSEISSAIQEAIQASISASQTPDAAAKTAGEKITQVNKSLKK